jgi:acetyl esterase/lipase
MKKLVLTLMILPIVSFGQLKTENWPPEIESDQKYIYKQIDGTDLNLWVFNPPKHNPSLSKPAIVFFFGGGFRGGTPEQFIKHCEYLSARGMVSIVADYRVLSRHNVTPIHCLKDAKSAIRWVRKNSKKLGINPNKIVSGGGSAGGFLAAATGTILSFDEVNEDKEISSKPNLMILFNPAVIMASTEGYKISKEKEKRLKQSLKVEPKDFSPYHFINDETPATLIFHGNADKTIKPQEVILFSSKMKDFGNSCKLYIYEGEEHAFFNYGRNHNGAFIDTVNKIDTFLVELGYISAPPKSIIK